MKKNYSFTEYVAHRFYNELYSVIKEHINANKDALDLRLHRVRTIDHLELSDIYMKHVSVGDLPGMAIEFEVTVKADILAYDHDKTEPCQQWFLIHCAGDIENNLSDLKIRTPIKIYRSKNTPQSQCQMHLYQ